MKKTIIINSEFFGEGDNKLGSQLMGSFLRKLCLEEKMPEKIVFYNSGVKLIAEGSPVLDAIEMLSKAGCEIIACGTCLNYYNLSDRVEPEMISDMPAIISIMMNSDKAITL